MMVGQEPASEKVDPIIELKNKFKRKAVILTILVGLALTILFAALCYIQIVPGIPLAIIIVPISILCFFADLVGAFYDWLIKDFIIYNELKKK